jgi:hypothetical protein
MNEIVKSRANEIILTLGVFGIAISAFHLVTDDYAYFMSSLAARQFSDFAYFDVHFQGFIGIREVYKLLYHLVPQLNWHFIFMLVYELTSLYLILRSLRVLILRRINNKGLITLIQILFGLFYIDNIIFVSHTRISLIYCGIALFNLRFTRDIRLKGFLSNGLIFILGMLLRPESCIGMLLMVGSGYLIYTSVLKGWFGISDAELALTLPGVSPSLNLVDRAQT